MTVKMFSRTFVALVLAGMVGGALPISGQEAKPTQTSGPMKAASLKVTVVIGRFQAEKRTGSLPFVLTVNTPGRPTTMQMGSSVPIPSDQAGNAFQYRSVGTNLNCSAVEHGDGRYTLRLTINDNQIFMDAPGAIKGIPAFQTFMLDNELILRDGQTAQLGTAVDKASGDVLKVDVTLNVIK
jgi:hypothetical protein